MPQCTNPDVLTFWTVTFPSQGEQQRTSLHTLLRRFSQLLTTETTRYRVSQPASRLNLLDAIERQQIVLAPLSHVTLGDLASAVGMLLLQQFVRAAFARPGTEQLVLAPVANEPVWEKCFTSLRQPSNPAFCVSSLSWCSILCGIVHVSLGQAAKHLL